MTVTSRDVSELIATFREALLALRPVADMAQLSWRDEDSHDDWERLAESAFDVFVRAPIFSDPENRSAQPLARYDFNIRSYEALSWIDVESEHGGDGLALVRFEARDGRFLSMWLEDPLVDQGSSRRGENRLWTPEVTFRFARRVAGSPVTFQRVVTPAE
jgi:hypothetical protein